MITLLTLIIITHLISFTSGAIITYEKEKNIK